MIRRFVPEGRQQQVDRISRVFALGSEKAVARVALNILAAPRSVSLSNIVGAYKSLQVSEVRLIMLAKDIEPIEYVSKMLNGESLTPEQQYQMFNASRVQARVNVARSAIINGAVK